MRFPIYLNCHIFIRMIYQLINISTKKKKKNNIIHNTILLFVILIKCI